ncbi:MAG: hypothetical protein IBJ15_06580, partial [Alphaproteobacteria bacterium]|nr:hypothetical protein [Alphaproteobacteria bacterium]
MSNMKLGAIGVVSASILSGMILAAGLAVALPAVAQQVTDTKASLVTPKAGDVTVRSGDGAMYYPVGVLRPGQYLSADGTSAEWLRVTLPAGALAVVRADEAELKTAGGTQKVVLNRRSTLRALNSQSPTADTSWKPLLLNPLPAGTELTLVEVMRSGAAADSPVVGYRVQPPPAARGFVLAADVR